MPKEKSYEYTIYLVTKSSLEYGIKNKNLEEDSEVVYENDITVFKNLEKQLENDLANVCYRFDKSFSVDNCRKIININDQGGIQYHESEQNAINGRFIILELLNQNQNYPFVSKYAGLFTEKEIIELNQIKKVVKNHSTLVLYNFDDYVFVVTEGIKAYHSIIKYADVDFGLNVASKIFDGNVAIKSSNFVGLDVSKQYSILKESLNPFDYKESVEFLSGKSHKELHPIFSSGLLRFGVPFKNRSKLDSKSFVEQVLGTLFYIHQSGVYWPFTEQEIPRFSKVSNVKIEEKLNEILKKFPENKDDDVISYWEFDFLNYQVAGNNELYDVANDVTYNNIEMVVNKDSDMELELIEKIEQADSFQDILVMIEENAPLILRDISINLPEGEVKKRLNLEKYLNLEIYYDDQSYLLQNGRWVVCNKDLINSINTRIDDTVKQNYIIYKEEFELNSDGSTNLFSLYTSEKKERNQHNEKISEKIAAIRQAIPIDNDEIKKLKKEKKIDYRENIYNYILSKKHSYELLDREFINPGGHKVELMDFYCPTEKKLFATKIGKLAQCSEVFDQAMVATEILSECRKNPGGETQKEIERYCQESSATFNSLSSELVFCTLICSTNNKEKIKEKNISSIKSLIFKIKLLNFIDIVKQNGYRPEIVLTYHKYKD